MLIENEVIKKAKKYFLRHEMLLIVLSILALFSFFLILLFLTIKYAYPKRETMKNIANDTVTNDNDETYLIDTLDSADCNAHTIACDQRFKDNKDLACGSFKGQVVDELIKRDESPCKGLEKSYVEAQLNEACSKGCVESTPTKIPESTPTPTHASQTTPTPTPDSFTIENVRFKLPGIGIGTSENTSPKKSTRNVKAILYKSDGTKISDTTSTFTYSNSTGIFSGNLAFNSKKDTTNYVTIAADATLSKKISNDVVDLVSGDIEMDNQMDIKDYNLVIGCYKNAAVCTGDKKQLADFNDDGVIGTEDINIVQRAFSTGKGELFGEY